MRWKKMKVTVEYDFSDEYKERIEELRESEDYKSLSEEEIKNKVKKEYDHFEDLPLDEVGFEYDSVSWRHMGWGIFEVVFEIEDSEYLSEKQKDKIYDFLRYCRTWRIEGWKIQSSLFENEGDDEDEDDIKIGSEFHSRTEDAEREIDEKKYEGFLYSFVEMLRENEDMNHSYLVKKFNIFSLKSFEREEVEEDDE
jgi:hypothetical protein